MNSGCSLLFIPVSLSRLLIHVAKQLCVIGTFFFSLNHVTGSKHLSVKQRLLVQA